MDFDVSIEEIQEELTNYTITADNDSLNKSMILI